MMGRHQKASTDPRGEVKLRRWLKDNKMSQKEFCDYIGVTPGTVSHWCSRANVPNLFYGLLISAATKGQVGMHDWLTENEVNRISWIQKNNQRRE